MNIFIDANILLDFYRLSSGDLEELRKIAKLSKANRIRLLISDYVKDEFYRNRESVIAEAVEVFKKSRLDLQLPILVRVYSTALELIKLKDAFESTKNALLGEVLENIDNASLIADSVISELFESTDIQIVTEEIIRVGTERSAHAKPPGKKESCGDAIHWEWLLTILPANEDLILIIRDEDFRSPLRRGELRLYLQDEWKSKKSSKCILFSSIQDFLKEFFPEIELVGDIDKLCAIEQLETATNFKITHSSITILNTFCDFTEPEILRLIDAYLTNDQVSRILGDDDVREFAFKLCDWAVEVGAHEEIVPLVEMLEKLAPTESGSS